MAVIYCPFSVRSEKINLNQVRKTIVMTVECEELVQIGRKLQYSDSN